MLLNPPWVLEVPGWNSTEKSLSTLWPETPRSSELTVYVRRELSDESVSLPELEIRPNAAVRSEVCLLPWLETEVRVPLAETDVLRES